MTQDRGHLLTEQQNQQSIHIDRMSIADSFDVINGEDRTVADAVRRTKPQICEAIQCVVRAFERGGRLFYVGAGTSGRLGIIDAAECPPTFMTPPEMVQGIIAGGEPAIRRSIEGAEDRIDDAVKAIAQCEVAAEDVVMGIATGGTTPFVHAALAEAKRRGAKTIFFACVPEHAHQDDADISIRVLTGPEVITGSTRMKAGTATKMVLNMITTISMIQIGKVFGNLMVDLNRDACAKLQDRAVRIVQAATDTSRNEAKQLLLRGEDVKTAIVMHFKNADREEASRMLIETHGRLDRIIERNDD
ncbi:MAG: N-acetylmuramic acid 6-phosphate etherase [Planctomycetota bacterium]|nr:N-acetylmuramic acid 6-phosphate etherase [Planctomycetota bacterium]